MRFPTWRWFPGRMGLRYEPAISVAVLLSVWSLAAWANHESRLNLFPGPWSVLQRFVELLPGELPGDIAASLSEAVGGWVSGSVLALIVGTLIGRSTVAAEILKPPLNFLRYISPLAWVPLAILWFGIGYKSKVAVIVLIAFFNVLVNTAHGMSSIDPVVLKAGRSLRLRPLQHGELILMAAMPDILVGLRFALGAAWGGVVISELVAGDTGLGALELFGSQAFDVSQVMVGMVTIALIGLMANSAFSAAQRWMFPWLVANRREGVAIT